MKLASGLIRSLSQTIVTLALYHPTLYYHQINLCQYFTSSELCKSLDCEGKPVTSLSPFETHHLRTVELMPLANSYCMTTAIAPSALAILGVIVLRRREPSTTARQLIGEMQQDCKESRLRYKGRQNWEQRISNGRWAPYPTNLMHQPLGSFNILGCISV